MKATKIEFSKDGLVINHEKYGFGIISMEIVSPNDIRITVSPDWEDIEKYSKIIPDGMNYPTALKRFDNIKIIEENKFKDFYQIIKHYGVLTQLKYFQSEVFELNEAIINAEHDGSQPLDIEVDHIAEEIADVMVMVRQFQKYYGIEDFEIHEIMKKKIDRQFKRIEDEIN